MNLYIDNNNSNDDTHAHTHLLLLLSDLLLTPNKS